MFYHYIPLLYTINNKFPTLDANACHARGRIFPRSQNGIAEKLKAADSKRYLCKLQRRSHWHKKRNNRSRNARVRVENRVVRFLWLPVYVIYPPPLRIPCKSRLLRHCITWCHAAPVRSSKKPARRSRPSPLRPWFNVDSLRYIDCTDAQRNLARPLDDCTRFYAATSRVFHRLAEHCRDVTSRSVTRAKLSDHYYRDFGRHEQQKDPVNPVDLADF